MKPLRAGLLSYTNEPSRSSQKSKMNSCKYMQLTIYIQEYMQLTIYDEMEPCQYKKQYNIKEPLEGRIAFIYPLIPRRNLR